MAADNGHPAGVNQPDVLSTDSTQEVPFMPAATLVPRSGRRKSVMPAFQFYPADFLADGDQMAMSLDEVGAYIRLLSHAWIKGGLVNDIPKLARMVGGTPPLVETVLREHFVLVHDVWRNPRQERERDRLAKYKKQASLAGQQSAKVRSTGVQRAFNGRSTGVERNANTSASASASASTPKEEEHRPYPVDDDPSESESDAAWFLTAYPQWYAEERAGARYMVKAARDFPIVQQLVQTWPERDHLEQMARTYLRSQKLGPFHNARSIDGFVREASGIDAHLRGGA